MSQSWAISEYSELYCLLFLSFANYLLIKNNLELRNIFIIGLSLSISTLINQGTVIFVIPFLIIFYKKLTKEKLTKILTVFGSVGSASHIISNNLCNTRFVKCLLCNLYPNSSWLYSIKLCKSLWVKSFL